MKGYDRDKQKALNAEAITNPKIGDYWHEMFCPYFIIVNIDGDKIAVLSCIGGGKDYLPDILNARIINDDNTWSFDYSKATTVTKGWIADRVTYKNIEGFCADVVRGKKYVDIAKQWKNAEKLRLRNELKKLK